MPGGPAPVRAGLRQIAPVACWGVGRRWVDMPLGAEVGAPRFQRPFV